MPSLLLRRAVRWPCGPLLGLAGLLVAACAAPPPAAEPAAPKRPLQDSAPVSPPPGLADLPDPVTRADPKTLRGNVPYSVFGKQYAVLETPAGYDAEGLASWYGVKFHANETTSGEVYDMYQLTAAHRSLPIPTYVRVTNLDNGKVTKVRVNDRGPFHPERIIDLSYAAAVKLGFEDKGTARVRVQALSYFVHTGSLPSLDQARALREELTTHTAAAASVVGAGDAYRVQVGPLASRWDAERLQAVLAFRESGAEIVEN